MIDPWDAILALQSALGRMDARVRELERVRGAYLADPEIMAFVDAVAAEKSIDAVEILSKRKFAPVAAARQEVMFRAFSAGKSYSEIGRFFGVDHTTVIHGVQKIKLAHDNMSWLRKVAGRH